MRREPENQPASENRQKTEVENHQPPGTEQHQLPAAADQQPPMTEHQQQLPSAADQQRPTTKHKQKLATLQQQLPSAAEEEEPTTEHIEIKHKKLAKSMPSLRHESSKEVLPTAPIRSLPVMPEVGKSYFHNLKFKYDRNPLYVIQCRGVMNVLHLALSLVLVIILGVACQLRPTESDSYMGFFCQPAATFLFVTSCGSFFTSVLLFICCMVSKKTEIMLFHTFFEASYYLLYFILLLMGSFCLMDRSYNSDDIMLKYMYNFNSGLIDAASIIGLINSILYGMSAFAFFTTHYYYGVFLKVFLKREEQPYETHSRVHERIGYAIK